MKMLIAVFSLALSFASLASSGESKTFIYDGSQSSVELMLRGEKTHTEYRYESRPSTCYRTEIVGYRTVCNGGYYGGGYPRPYPGPQNCYQQPIYRQVAYTCMQTIQIPFEVKDFDVDARVVIDVTNLSTAATPGETFKVTLQGDDLSVATVGSKKFILMLKKQDIRANINGNVKMMDANYSVEMIEAAPVLKALDMTKITYSTKPVLTFNIGPVADMKYIGFGLNVTHKKTIGADTVLINRDLLASEVEVTRADAMTVAGVNLQNLGIKFKEGKFTMTAKAFFRAEGSIMNKSQFDGALETSRTLNYKVD